jgi:hypothetical protein
MTALQLRERTGQLVEARTHLLDVEKTVRKGVARRDV